MNKFSLILLLGIGVVVSFSAANLVYTTSGFHVPDPTEQAWNIFFTIVAGLFLLLMCYCIWKEKQKEGAQ